MLVLDTDHLAELDRGSSAGARLRDRLDTASDEVIATTIISAEEQLRGWLAQIHKLQDPYDQIAAYDRLQRRLARAALGCAGGRAVRAGAATAKAHWLNGPQDCVHRNYS